MYHPILDIVIITLTGVALCGVSMGLVYFFTHDVNVKKRGEGESE